MKEFQINPKDFIREPYTTCPECKEKTFGRLGVYNESYSKRCTSCWHTGSFDLPLVQKKVIYLDQFFITHIAFLSNPELKKPSDPFFEEAYKKLNLLRRAQIIACPYSSGHVEESAIAHGYAPYLKEVYKNLSGSSEFKSFPIIERFQIQQGFKLWLTNDLNIHGLNKYEFIQGNSISWEDWFHISVEYPWKDEYTESIRASRKEFSEGITEVFQRWKKETHKNFTNWYEEECHYVGQHYFNTAKKTFAELSQGIVNYPFCNEYVTFRGLLSIAEEQVDPQECLGKVVEYLTTEHFRSLPFIIIESALWASIAHEAAHTMKKSPPNKGMGTDIQVTARLLPYCDALFLDKGMHQYANHPNVRNILNRFDCKLFSLSTKSEFISYLNDLILGITDDHIKILRLLYGQDIVTEVEEHKTLITS